MIGAQSAVESENAEEASTFRLGIQSATADGSETPIRKTVEDINDSLIANRNIVNPTKEEWERSGALDPDIQPSRVPDTSVAPPQWSMVGLLWNPEVPESASLTSNHDGDATKAGAGEDQTKGLPDEDHGISFLVRYHLGGEVPGDGAQETVQTSGVEAGELHQSRRKRTWPTDKRLSSPFPRSFIHPLPGAMAQQRAVNRDISSSKRPAGSSDHKRSKRCE